MDVKEQMKIILKRKLQMLLELQNWLTTIAEKPPDATWGADKLKTIRRYFDELQRLDIDQEALRINNDDLHLDKEILSLVGKLELMMSQIKNVIALFQIRLQGGRQLIKVKLHDVLNGSAIKGYKITIS